MSENIDSVMTAFLPDFGAKLHVREIARLVKMNRQTASETLKKMEGERILDSQTEGRNKLYFINKASPKAKILIQNAENRKKLDICAKRREISRLVEYLDGSGVALLFGSYTKGIERESSDIDIMLIGRGKDFGAFKKETGREVHVFEMEKKQFLGKLAKKDHLVIEAVRNHVCLRNAEKFIELMWRSVYG